MLDRGSLFHLGGLYMPQPQSGCATGVIGVPVYLGGTVTVRPGGQAAPNPLAFKAPDTYPLWVHAIQMGFRTTSGLSTPLVSSNDLGVQFSLGAFKITNTFVPLGCFTDRAAAVLVGTGVAQQGSTSLWILRKPLLVPAGAILLPTFRNLGESQNVLTAHVQYQCSIATSVGSIVHVPYVTAWAGKSLVFNDADTDESAENDLVNDSDESLILDKFEGAISYTSAASAFTTDHDLNYGSGAGGVGQLLQLKIRDSDDRAIVDQFTAWDCIFPYISRAFNVSRTLNGGAVIKIAPRKYVKVYLNKLAPGSAIASDKLQPYVAMFGHREIRR